MMKGIGVYQLLFAIHHSRLLFVEQLKDTPPQIIKL